MMKYILFMAILLLLASDLLAEESVGKQIYTHCKVCHGFQGQGGKDGKYPRIAGLPQTYIEEQLTNFKSRKRINKPMVPIFKNWRFNQDAIQTVAAYVAALPLNVSSIPAYEPSAEILAQFDSHQEFLEVGEDLFQDCVQCHDEGGQGKQDKGSPPLVPQYSAYLRKQIGDFAVGRRIHENAESLFSKLEADEVEALLGYIATLSQE